MANLTITDDDGGLSESLNHEDSQEIYKKCFTLPDYYKQCLSFYHKGELTVESLECIKCTLLHRIVYMNLHMIFRNVKETKYLNFNVFISV